MLSSEDYKVSVWKSWEGGDDVDNVYDSIVTTPCPGKKRPP